MLKAASVAGLLVGRRRPAVGRLTADALVAYFACALGAHARVGDEAWRYAAAAGMLGLVLVARQAYADDVQDEQVIDLAPEPVVDLTAADARDLEADDRETASGARS